MKAQHGAADAFLITKRDESSQCGISVIIHESYKIEANLI